MKLRSLCVVGSTILLACSSSGSTGPTSPTGGDPVARVAAADTARGRTVFEGHGCNGCHGGKMSTGSAPSFASIAWDDAEVREAVAIIGKGEGSMPAFGDRLSDQQIADVVAYLKTLGK